jgi:hypothetical protein
LEQPINNFSKPELEIRRENVKLKGIENILNTRNYNLMACQYLLWGGPFYKFHEFAMLFIKHLLNTLMHANIIEASLVRLENGDVLIYTPITDYSCCLDSLEHCGNVCHVH